MPVRHPEQPRLYRHHYVKALLGERFVLAEEVETQPGLHQCTHRMLPLVLEPVLRLGSVAAVGGGEFGHDRALGRRPPRIIGTEPTVELFQR